MKTKPQLPDDDDNEQKLPADAPYKPLPPDRSDREALLRFALKFDAPVPLEFFAELISRASAFRARAEGKLTLEEVRSRAGIRPSELARYLKNEPRIATSTPSQ